MNDLKSYTSSDITSALPFTPVDAQQSSQNVPSILHFFRHGTTLGNERKAYIGETDEPLSAKGRKALAPYSHKVAQVFVTSKCRTQETATLLFPKAEQRIVQGLEEMNFGIFEQKNSLDLTGDPSYQHWVDQGCRSPCPQGEGLELFRERVASAFLNLMSSCPMSTPTATPSPMSEQEKNSLKHHYFVVHGGTIMALTSTFLPNTSYFDYQIPCGTHLSFGWNGHHFSHWEGMP